MQDFYTWLEEVAGYQPNKLDFQGGELESSLEQDLEQIKQFVQNDIAQRNAEDLKQTAGTSVEEEPYGYLLDEIRKQFAHIQERWAEIDRKNNHQTNYAAQFEPEIQKIIRQVLKDPQGAKQDRFMTQGDLTRGNRAGRPGMGFPPVRSRFPRP